MIKDRRRSTTAGKKRRRPAQSDRKSFAKPDSITRKQAKPAWRGEVEHVQSCERNVFHDLADLTTCIEKYESMEENKSLERNAKKE